MKFTKRLLSLLLSLLLAFSLSGCKTSTEQGKSGQTSQKTGQEQSKTEEQKQFDKFLDRQVKETLSQNTLNLHYQLKDPEKYGIKQEKVSIGHISPGQDKKALKENKKTAEELSGQIFSSLAVMVIEGKKVPQTDYPAIGLGDEMFLRNTEGKTVPMTKQEIRAVALSRLQITEDACVYDVGAGTGSVSIEAALTARGGRVYAIEKNPQAVEQLHKNRELFGAQNMQIVSGSAPQALLPLPAPDFVFVGGSSGNLSEILQLCFSKNPKVRVVVTAVTLETVGEMLCCAKELGQTFPNLCFEVTQVSCARSRQAGNYHLMNGMNPVWIGCLFQKED